MQLLSTMLTTTLLLQPHILMSLGALQAYWAEMIDEETVLSYFQYIPSIVAASVVLALFFIVTLVVAIQTATCKRSRPRYMWVVVFTGGLEVRASSAHIHGPAASKPACMSMLTTCVVSRANTAPASDCQVAYCRMQSSSQHLMSRI